MTTVYEHLERYAGQITAGWKTDADGHDVPIQVVLTESGPYSGTVTYSTLGLSHFPLKLAESGNIVRLELLMIFPNDKVPGNAPGVLQQVGLSALARGQAYAPGDVIGPYGRMFDGSDVTALYVTGPIYFPEEFASVEAPGIGQVYFAWLVPIFDDEAKYIANNGSSEFEDLMERENPDVTDLKRDSVISSRLGE